MKVRIIRKVKGDEHDGHVERSRHQGLRNVREQQSIGEELETVTGKKKGSESTK